MLWTRLRHLAGSLLVVLALSLTVLPSAGAATIVEVSAGDEPGAFVFQGSGFERNELVRFAISGPNGAYTVLSERSTGSDGNVSYAQQLPRYLQPGQWTITLRGEDSRLEASANFVMPYLGPNAAVELSQIGGQSGQASGQGDTVLRVVSRDFDDGETVHYWLTGPDGQIYGSGRHEADEGKRTIRFSTVISGEWPRGEWKLSVYGVESDRLAITSVVVS